jgi:hypothetical protein
MPTAERRYGKYGGRIGSKPGTRPFAYASLLTEDDEVEVFVLFSVTGTE